MIELERLALMGDRQAQKECTRHGIVLPCPKCGSKWTQVRHMGWPGPAAFRAGYRGECTDCHIVTDAYQTEQEALSDWNTRSGLFIEKCKNCEHWRGDPNDPDAICGLSDGVMESFNCCRDFEPRRLKNEIKRSD